MAWNPANYNAAALQGMRNFRARYSRYLYEEALKSKYKPNGKSVEIIGLPSAVLTHITTEQTPGSLTQTIFDTDSRADSAQILLTNSTGASKVIIAAWIRGKPVTRYGDSSRPMTSNPTAGGRGGMGQARGGYLHDKFVDYESIAKNGERTFETGNNFTVTADQVNKLADYYWKYNKTKKHIYTLSLVGMQTWYEPGEWYTLQIGGAGQAEYIDSTVECMGVQCSLSAGGAPSTSVAFREVEESWKFDSNEVARQIAAGDFSRRTNSNVVTVAAQYYPGYADYYCDGTDDQEEINGASEYLVSGGKIKLTRGDYNLTSSITLTSNITLSGDGNGTVVRGNATSMYAILCDGTASSYLENIVVEDIRFDQIDTSLGCDYIYYRFVRNGMLRGISATTIKPNAILCEDCEKIKIIDNNFDVGSASSQTQMAAIALRNVSTSSGSNIIQGNTIKNLSATETAIGISVAGGVGNQVTNNIIDHLSYVQSTGAAYGIYVLATSTTVVSNKVINCHGHSTLASVTAIHIATGSTYTQSINNYCYNNGKDTGLANTNQNNFFDAGTDTQWAG